MRLHTLVHACAGLAAAHAVANAQLPSTQQELQARIRRSVDSALRVERAGTFRLDTSAFYQGNIKYPLMIFPDSFRRHIMSDTIRRGGAWNNLWEHNAAMPYTIGFVNSDWRTLNEDRYIGYSPMVYWNNNVAATTSAPVVRLAAAAAPAATRFPGPPLAISKLQPSVVLAAYVEDRLFRSGWPAEPTSQAFRDSTVLSVVTDFLIEPETGTRRQRQVAYMIRLTSRPFNKCTRIAIYWLTESKGAAESEWSTQREDASYVPSTRGDVVRWFENMKGCP